MKWINTLVVIVAMFGTMPMALPEASAKRPVVRIWDTGKLYTQKNPMSDAWKDRANWVQVPYGKSDYKPRGDLMIENDYFYLFLFANKDDSVDLMAKLSTGGFKPNEIYKVNDTGGRNFGHGTMWVQILKSTHDEVVVKHAGEGQKDKQPVVTIYHVLAGKPWLEVRPVERVNQQGMHGKSRICAFVKKEGEDFILDSKREPFTEEVIIPAPEGTIGIINFSRRFRTDHDFMWFMAFPPGVEKHPLTYLGFHADPFWEDARSDRPSVGAQYAYMGQGGVFIGVLNAKDNWKREDVGHRLAAGENYRTRFRAPYPGRWKLVARLDGRYVHKRIEIREAGEQFIFRSETGGLLDYILVYLWDDTAATPASVFTPMDVYREALGRDIVRVWDANKKYTMKHYDMRAWSDRANWSQVPYGVTDYQFRGDCILEGENFWVSLHSSRYDSVFLYAKTDSEATPGRHNEIYRAFDTPNGRWTNYGSGSESCKIITNTPGEIEVESGSITYTRKGYETTVVTRYRLRGGKPLLEISPVSQADMQGMHGESRFVLAPEAAEDGGDFVEDSLRHPDHYACRVPNRARMLLDLIMDDDTIWVLTSRHLPEGTQFERRPTRFSADNAAGGWHAGWSRIGEGDCDRVWTAPFIQFAGKPVHIGVLRIGYWHYQRIGQDVTKGEPVTLNWRIAYTRQIRSSPFEPDGTWRPLYPGKWRLVACINGRYYTVPIKVAAEQMASTSSTFDSPATGKLEYVLFYLYDRTDETPGHIRTPMDIFREVQQP